MIIADIRLLQVSRNSITILIPTVVTNKKQEVNYKIVQVY